MLAKRAAIRCHAIPGGIVFSRTLIRELETSAL